MTELLKDRRPPEVIADIGRQFQESPTLQYRYTGQDWSYHWYTHPPISTSDLFNQPGLSVLDVGCGAGQVIRRYERASQEWGVPARVLGVTATAYAEENPFVKVGDMHNLVDYAGDQRWQRVMSRYTLMHSPDALAVYEQMLNLVDKNGTVTTDMFGHPDRPSYIGGYMRFRADIARTVLSYLVKSGHFRIIALESRLRMSEMLDYPPYYIPEMHIKRLSDPDTSVVQLPLDYSVSKSGLWHYKITEPDRNIVHGSDPKFHAAMSEMMRRRYSR